MQDKNTPNEGKPTIYKQRNGCYLFIFFLFAIALAVMAYFLGYKNASKTIDSIAMNNVLIQQIAELSSLEVQGTASIKSSNIANDGSLSDELKKVFLERTVNITVPYVAKYGVDLEKQNINIEEENNQVYIVLPNPKLLSYELRLDKTDAMTRKGLFEAGNDAHFTGIHKKLYAQSRSQLEQNKAYIQQTKDKIRQIITAYYAPMNLKVDIAFTDELKSRVVEQPRQ